MGKLCIEEVQGRNCLTDFHGLDLTWDKQCSLIKKFQAIIEAHVDVKTADGYLVRMFVMAFTKRRPDQVKTNCYAQTAQIRRIRAKMTQVIVNEAGKVPLRELVKKLIPEAIRKVKILKKPKFDITKLMELHQGGDDYDAGAALGRPEDEEAKNILSASVQAADGEEE